MNPDQPSILFLCINLVNAVDSSRSCVTVTLPQWRLTLFTVEKFIARVFCSLLILFSFVVMLYGSWMTFNSCHLWYKNIYIHFSLSPDHTVSSFAFTNCFMHFRWGGSLYASCIINTIFCFIYIIVVCSKVYMFAERLIFLLWFIFLAFIIA